jgi:hypothetical protein
MNEFEKNWRRWSAVCTEKIEELLLAWMQPGLEHSGFSQLFRFLGLEQNPRYVFACRPKRRIDQLIQRQYAMKNNLTHRQSEAPTSPS